MIEQGVFELDKTRAWLPNARDAHPLDHFILIDSLKRRNKLISDMVLQAAQPGASDVIVPDCAELPVAAVCCKQLLSVKKEMSVRYRSSAICPIVHA